MCFRSSSDSSRFTESVALSSWESACAVFESMCFAAANRSLGGRQERALAFCRQRYHRAGMSVQITIHDVPDSVRDELAARAALQGKSMQEYLRAELERLAARPPIEKVLERIQERKATTGTRLSPEEILGHRDADRR